MVKMLKTLVARSLSCSSMFFIHAVDGLFVKALEHHGFTTVQDILLLNQAERDALHFPKADGILSILPIGCKNRLLVVKLFGQYCEDEGKPIVNWKHVTRNDFIRFIISYDFEHIVEKLSVHPSFKADSVHALAEAPAKAVQAGIDLKPSTSSSVKEAEIIAASSSFTCIHKQTMAKSHVHHVVPVMQQEILHDFLLKINQGSFGIPCGGKVCHSSACMNHVSWPLESSVLPRTLAQLACQDFKKEPPDSFATVLSPPIFHCFSYSATAQLWQNC